MSEDLSGDGSPDASENSENGDACGRLRPLSALSKKNGKSRLDRPRRVCFPLDDSQLVTGYLEPVNPWQSVEEISSEELIGHYVKSCEQHRTLPLDNVVRQLKECPVYGGARRGTLCLSLRALEPAACEALEAILRRARFTRIELAGAGLTDQTAVALFDMIEYYESASEIDISGNNAFGILGWQACSRMVNKSLWLEQLEARETYLSESTALVLGRALRPSCVLRCLHLQRSRLAGLPLRCLAGALKQNKSVRELHLGDNQLVPEDAHHLASLLRCNSWLQLLDVSNNQIQDAGIEAIADALAEQSTLHSPSSSSSSESTVSSPQSGSSGSFTERGLAVLVVWNNNLTRNSGQHFSKALSRCRSLEVLNMGQNPLGGEAVNRFRSALQQNRSLLCLGVQGARLGAEAAVALAEVIEDNPVIQRIDLRDNKLHVAGLLALATALRKNLGVTRLDLDEAPPQTNGVEQPLEEARLVEEIRSLCQRNEAHNLQGASSPSSEDTPQRRRVASFTTRKISLTCQTLYRTSTEHPAASEPTLSPPKGISGRLRSPLPSPVPSPVSSPVPSPSHRSRFQVSRVSDSSSITSESPSPSTPPGSRSLFPVSSRFKVVSLSDPLPSISVVAPDDNVKNFQGPMINVSSQTESEVSQRHQIKNSRFSVVRYGPSKNNDRLEDSTKQSKPDLQESECKIVIGEIDKKTEVKNEGPTKEDSTNEGMKQFEVITQDLDNLLDEMKDDRQMKRKMSDVSSCSIEALDSVNIIEPLHVLGAIKKNKSETSLDSPDLEVSRLMNQSKPQYDSTSSLDISGSSMESLNTLEVDIVKNNDLSIKNDAIKHDRVVFSIQDDDEPFTESEQDVFPLQDHKNPFICSIGEGVFKNHGRKLVNLSASSNESSLESSTFEAGVTVHLPPCSNQFGMLNSSVSSNESVSPNIFGKHMKLHGSVTSLEASISSVDSYKSGNNAYASPLSSTLGTFTFPSNDNALMDSVDSGICQSETKTQNASLNESFSSNEGTLTSNSNLKSSFFSMGRDSSLSIESDNGKSTPTECAIQVAPRRVASHLDVPSVQKQRSRKISWVAPSNFNTTNRREPEEQPARAPLSLPEKLMSIFHPGNYFSKLTDGGDKKGSDSSQSSSRRDSQTSTVSSSGTSFWPWSLGSSISSSKTCDSKTSAALDRLKKYGESFESALQFGDSDAKPQSSVDVTNYHLKSNSDSKIQNADSSTFFHLNVDAKPEKVEMFNQTSGVETIAPYVNIATEACPNVDIEIKMFESSPNVNIEADMFKSSKDVYNETKVLEMSPNVNIEINPFEASTNMSIDTEVLESNVNTETKAFEVSSNVNIKTKDENYDSKLQENASSHPHFDSKHLKGFLDSEYVNQTISECVVHPFTSCPLSTDFTVRLPDHREFARNTCTCVDSSGDKLVIGEDALLPNFESSKPLKFVGDTELTGAEDNTCVKAIILGSTDTVHSGVEVSAGVTETILGSTDTEHSGVEVNAGVTATILGSTDTEPSGPEFNAGVMATILVSTDNELHREDIIYGKKSIAFPNVRRDSVVDAQEAIHTLQEQDVTDVEIVSVVPNKSEMILKELNFNNLHLKGVSKENIANVKESKVSTEELVVKELPSFEDVTSVKGHNSLNDSVTSDVEKTARVSLEDSADKETAISENVREDCESEAVLGSEKRIGASKSTNSNLRILKERDGVGVCVCDFKISETDRRNVSKIVGDLCAEAEKIVRDKLKPVRNCDKIAEFDDTGRGDEGGVPVYGGRSESDRREYSNKVQNVVLNVCDSSGEDKCIININEGLKTDCKEVNIDLIEENRVPNKNLAIAVRDENVKSDDEILKIREPTRPTDLHIKTNQNVAKLAYSTVLKQSIGLENKTLPSDRQLSPESGPSVENLPSKIIRRIKENISPENTLTSSMSNTKALAQELMERRNVLGANSAIWDISLKENSDKKDSKLGETDKLADEVISRLYDEILVEPLMAIKDGDNLKDDSTFAGTINLDSRDKNSNDDFSNKCLGDDNRNSNTDKLIVLEHDRFTDNVLVEHDTNENRSSERSPEVYIDECAEVDEGSDALTILDLMSDDVTCDNSVLGEDVAATLECAPMQSALNNDYQIYEADIVTSVTQILDRNLSKDIILDGDSSMVDVSKNVTVTDILAPEIAVDVTKPLELNLKETVSIAINVVSEMLEKMPAVEIKVDETKDLEVVDDFKPVSILKKSATDTKATSLPKDIPEPNKTPFPLYGFTHPTPSKKSVKGLPVRCGSLPENSTSISVSPKSFQETLTSHQSRRAKARSPVNTLGKMARDSLYALNMNEDEIEELRESGRLASLESVKSLGSVSEDIEDMCRSSSDSKSLEQGMSQDSLASLGSISEMVSEPENTGGAKGYETN